MARSSLAVLYFTSRDSTDAYLADGLTEDLTTLLARRPGIQVRSGSSVRVIQQRTGSTPRALGRALAVRYIVVGTLRRAPDRVRLNVQLVEATTETSVWGESYDRTPTGLLDLPDQIATALAERVAGRTRGGTTTAITTVWRTRNPEALDELRRGNWFLAGRVELDSAFRHFERSASLDPGFAAPLARAAYTLALQRVFGAGAGSVQLGFSLAGEALRRDSLSSDAWMALGYLRYLAGASAMQPAEQAFLRALELDSMNAEAWHQYASVQSALGDLAGAAWSMRRALALEPGRAISLNAGVDSVPPGVRAVLARVPRGARSREVVSVYVVGEERVRALVASMPFVSLADSSSADVQVRDTGGVVRVFADGIPLPPLPEYSPDWVRRATVGGEVLEGYAPSQEALCPPLARALAIAALKDIENPAPPYGIRLQVSLTPSGQAPVARPPAPRNAPDTAYIGRTYDLWVRVHATEASTLYLSAAVEGFASTPAVIYPSQEGMNQPVAVNVWVPVMRDIEMVEPPGLEVVKFYVGSDQFAFNSLLASLSSCEARKGMRGVVPAAARTPQPVVGWITMDYGILVLRAGGAPGAAAPGRGSHE